MSYPSNPVTFSCFCKLVSEIRRIPPRKKNGARSSSAESREMRLLKGWINWLKSECPAGVEGTGVIFFRLFFPEEGVRRRCVFFFLWLRWLQNCYAVLIGESSSTDTCLKKGSSVLSWKSTSSGRKEPSMLGLLARGA